MYCFNKSSGNPFVSFPNSKNISSYLVYSTSEYVCFDFVLTKNILSKSSSYLFKNDIGLKYLDKNTGIYTLDLRVLDLKKNKFEAVLTDRTDIVLTITYGKLLDIEVLSNYDYLINELKYILN